MPASEQRQQCSECRVRAGPALCLKPFWPVPISPQAHKVTMNSTLPLLYTAAVLFIAGNPLDNPT